MMKKNTFFPTILITSALILSSCAAYYSIYGIANLFSGAIISVGIMMGTLEVCKLVATTFLFRYWKTCKTFLKTYMSISVVILMLLTSSGIYGYLSAAYQKSEIQNKILSQKIELVEGQKVTYNSQIEQYKKRIEFSTQLRESQEKRLTDLLKNDSITKNIVQLQEVQSQASELINRTENDITEQNKKIQTALDNIKVLDKDVFDIKLQSFQQKDILTFQFVAETFGTTISKVVKWLIMLLIFVFDPLAICMLLAYNTIIYDDVVEPTHEPEPTKISEPIVTPDVKSETVSVPTPKKETKMSTFKKILRKPFGR